MSALLGLPEGVAQRPTACIIDARLALAPGGIVLALRLSRIVPVWLTRSFWELVDGAYFYRSFPEVLTAEQADDSAADQLVEALALWHSAWLNGSLNGVFFWIGDARRESALPAAWSSEVIGRYESLARGFASAASSGKGNGVDPLKECGKEAFALAAALAADPPIILTVAEKRRGSRPRICREAEEVAEIHDPPKSKKSAEWTDGILPGEIRPLMAQLRELGIRIAAVHTLAPGAVTLPPLAPTEDAIEAERPEQGGAARPWDGAHVFWHELS